MDNQTGQFLMIPSPAPTTPAADRRPTLPALVTASGQAAAVRFLEFFAVTIRNQNTRRAYMHQVTGVIIFWAFYIDR